MKQEVVDEARKKKRCLLYIPLVFIIVFDWGGCQVTEHRHSEA